MINKISNFVETHDAKKFAIVFKKFIVRGDYVTEENEQVMNDIKETLYKTKHKAVVGYIDVGYIVEEILEIGLETLNERVFIIENTPVVEYIHIVEDILVAAVQSPF